MFAVLGLGLSLLAFRYDYQERVADRQGRETDSWLRAWEFVVADVPINGAKLAAVDLLLPHGSLKGAHLPEIELIEHDLAGLDFVTANLESALFQYSDLTGADFRNANLSKANFVDADLTEADLSGAILSDAVLVGTILKDATLVGADLEGADLTSAILAGADLTDANLKDSHLYIVEDISRADFRGADLRASAADTEAIFQHLLDTACGDNKTLLPPNRTIPNCSKLEWWKDRKREWFEQACKKLTEDGLECPDMPKEFRSSF